MVSTSDLAEAGPARASVKPVPVWTTVIAVALGLFAAALGLMALISPGSAPGYVSGADQLAQTWGGRNLGLGVVLLVAVLLRSAAGYVVAFAAQLCREAGDLIVAFPNVAGLVITAAFVVIDVAGLVGSMIAWKKQRRRFP